MRRRSYVATLGAGITSLVGFVAVGKPNWLLELGKGKSGKESKYRWKNNH